MVTPPVPPMVPPKLLLPVGESVNAFAPRSTELPATPDNAPMLCAPAADRSSVLPGAARATVLPAASEPPLPICNVPALIVVPPV